MNNSSQHSAPWRGCWLPSVDTCGPTRFHTPSVHKADVGVGFLAHLSSGVLLRGGAEPPTTPQQA